MRCQKFGGKRNWSWLGFGLAKFGGLALFFALVAKLVKKWSCGLCAMLLENCHKFIQNEVWKVSLQKELILFGFWLSQIGGLEWSRGFGAILEANCHKCIQNEVWNLWFQKEFILVGFRITQVWWLGVKSWFWSNLGGELSQMPPKWGVKILVSKEIELGWVLA